MAGSKARAHADATGSGESEFATFYVGEMLMGLDIRRIEEINRQLDVTRVPHAPTFVCGVVNLRGEVVTVLDLRTILGLPASPITKSSRNVIVRHGSERAGLLVDRVADVVGVAAHEVEPPPINLNGIDGAFFEGVYKLDSALLVLLNVEQVLTGQAQRTEQAA